MYNKISGRPSLTRLIEIGVIVLFLLSLVPILYVSHYAHPLADDFSYGAGAHNAFVQTHSLVSTLFAAVEQVKSSYISWQGTYSAIFIFALQPAVFSEKLYFLTTYIMLGSLCFSTFLFVKVFLHDWIGISQSEANIVCFSLLIITIQFVPSQVSAFYWFNGSAYYTLFYSVSLVFWSLVGKVVLLHQNHSHFHFGVLVLLVIFLGGANFTTLLLTAELLFLLTIFLIYKKSPHRFMFLFLLALYLICFLVNVLAPGNSVRAESSAGMSPLMAIIKSIIYTLAFYGTMLQIPHVLFFLFISPILFRVAASCSFKFQRPLFVFILSNLLFASQLTPSFFATSFVGPGRQSNIYYYSFLLLIGFNLTYLYGWIIHTFGIPSYPQAWNKIQQKDLLIILAVLTCLWCGSVYHNYRDMTSASTAIAIADGSVYAYGSTYQKNMSALSSNETNISIEEHQNIPIFFSEYGLSKDPNNWVNKAMSNFYGKSSITVTTTE